MAKVTDLINNNDQITFSFEVTPDLSVNELDNLEVEPQFYSITWHAKTHQNASLDIAPLRLAKYLRSHNKTVLLHLSCDLLKKQFLTQLLTFLQDNKICNLLTVLGERFDSTLSDFQNSESLIKAIREEAGDYFCIGVAGSPDYGDDKLVHVKRKVDVGANYVLTQAFFEPSVYPKFRQRCKEAGINVPIIPGLFPFETYEQLSRFVNLCKIKVSQNILDHFIGKEDSNKIPGRDLTQILIKSISSETDMKHFHLFTLNKLVNTVSIIKPLL